MSAISTPALPPALSPAPPLAPPLAQMACNDSPATPRRVGRFAETRSVRWLRRAFAVLGPAMPELAARLAYVLLTRPPRVPERAWQARLRERAEISWVRVGHKYIRVYRWGSGPTVLLVHGWGARGTHLGRMVPALVKAGYSAVAFDALGHGASSGRSITLPEFAQSVAAVAAHAGEIHTLIAHSFGVAMALWAQLDFGVRAERQVLFSSLAYCKWVTEEFASLVGLPLAVLERGRQIMVNRCNGLLDWDRLSVGQMLSQTTQPTLMLHDAEDPEVPFEHLFALITACATRPLELHVTQGLGHHRLLGDRTVIERVLDFIGTPDAPSKMAA